MDLYNKLKSFLGIPTQTNRTIIPDQNQHDNSIWGPQDEDYSNRQNELEPFESHPGRGFSVFSDPLEIHKYFEQQMEDMLRNFGFGNFTGPFINEFEDNNRSQEFSQSPDDLRKQFLKPVYDKPIPDRKSPDKVDKDIDGTLNLGELDSILDGNVQKSPALKPNIGRSIFSGSSSSSRTIMNGDGSMEMHSTVKDSEGNVETKITKKLGDKEYTVIKRRNRDGKEEIVENFVNITQDEVAKYFPSVESPKINSPSLYDKFFK